MYQDSILFEPSFFQDPLFSSEESQSFLKNMSSKYANLLQDRFFSIESGSIKDIFYLKLTLQNKDESFFYPVMARMHYDEHKRSKSDSALLLVDYLDYYFAQYLKDEEVLLTTEWSEYECEGHKIQLVGQVFNLKLEKEADALLKNSML